ncbi:DUF445 family protein [Paenibacillus sp. PK4536]|uniref:DUF445 domain-containing protein n=1 Tax=Paenibacillus sp. PK4536 TaxID=3024576 RepID=UPI002358AE75|nr:DUF445 family protein [Paenibacillus sp. PK4536]WIM40600.1 DUF445 family protein [Paenibacillus sp. PK4536]
MKSKYLAGGSLAIMALGFIATLFFPKTTLLLIIQGGFEAGLVGGIADWFAVTALFRHPLGIPIPHTSLLTRNRDKIIRSLISAMENELLNKESIENKLRQFRIFPFALSMLTRQLGKKKMRRELLNMMIPPIERLPLEPVATFIGKGLANYTQKADLQSAATTVLTNALNERYDEKALDHILKEVRTWAARPQSRDTMGKIAHEQLANINMGGLKGFAFQAFAGMMNEESLGSILQNMIISGVGKLQEKDSEYREAIIRELRIQMFQVVDEEDNWLKIKDWTAELIQGEFANAFMMERLEELRRLLISMLEQERDGGGRHVFAIYRSIIRDLGKDPQKVAVWEDRLLQGIIRTVEKNHYRIGILVKENLDRMDDAALVYMLEEKVGQDLQWIRVNGAVCGFLVGIILSLIQLI